MKKSSVSRTRRFTYFQVLCYVLERCTRTHNQKLSGKTSWRDSRVHHNTELWTHLMVSQWNSSGIFSQDSPHCSSATKSKSSCQKMSEQPEEFTGRIIFMSMFNDISWGSQDSEKEYELSAQLVSLYARRFSPGRWSFLGPGSEKKWYSTHDSKPQGEWDRVAESMMIRFKESGHPVSRATSPLSRGTLKRKGGGKLSIHFCADGGNDWNCFSHNHFCQSAQYLRSSPRFVWGIQYLSDKNGETRIGRAIWPIFRASRLIDKDTQTFDWCTRKFIEKVQGTSGKASTTRSGDEDLHWCRILENSWSRTILHDKTYWRVLTICRASDMSRGYVTTRRQINWPERLDSREHQKLGPCWKSQPVICKVNTELKSELNMWTKTLLTRGSEILMAWTSWSRTWATRRTTKAWDAVQRICVENECTCFCEPIKAKAKPQRRISASSSTRTVLICERSWTDVEPETCSHIAFSVSKRMSTLLRHGPLLREEDGAIEFWRLNDDLRNKLEHSQYWSDDVRKGKMAGGGDNKKRLQYCTDPSGQEILYLRALHCHSGRNPIDPSLQDNVLIPNNCFEYTYHIGCAVSLHSITNSGLIPGG